MKTNVKPLHRAVPVPVTAEGAPAAKITPLQQLRRLIMTAMLWEDGAYESGKSVAERVAELIPQVDPQAVVTLAIMARNDMKLRHMPLFIAREMARGPVTHRVLVAGLLEQVIQRADELAEFLAIYWKDQPDAPISAQVKKGLARAFNKFDEYQLAKYNRDGAVKLRDVAFLTHVKPANPDLVARLVNKTTIPEFTKGGHRVFSPASIPTLNAAGMAVTVNPGLDTPDTWEVELSAGKGEDKLGSWNRLLAEGKLKALAFLRNLRNMNQAGVSDEAIKLYASTLNVSRVLPYRFIAAARVVPQYEAMLEPLMFKALEGVEKLPGRTIILVDVSTSMNSKVSAKSDLTRQDAALALAMLARELCEDVHVMAFNHGVGAIPPRRGFALGDAIMGQRKITRDGTDLGGAVAAASALKHDRLIVLTDEQSHTRVDAPVNPGRSYMINVAANRNGVGYGAWNHIDGWSEAVFQYIQTMENLE